MALFLCVIKTLEPDLIICYMVIELPQNCDPPLICVENATITQSNKMLQ
jgi:hypothetical protein